MENLTCLDYIYQNLALKQLFVLQAKIEKQISDKIKTGELPKMEVARLKHSAIKETSILTS